MDSTHQLRTGDSCFANAVSEEESDQLTSPGQYPMRLGWLLSPVDALAEVDGNRTRRTGIARPTRFEGGGAHQVPGHLRLGRLAGVGPNDL